VTTVAMQVAHLDATAQAALVRAGVDEFPRGGVFRSAVAAAGLPLPRVEPLGEVHRAVARRGVAR